LAGRVLGLLAQVRSEVFELWHEVEATNAARPVNEETMRRVTFYVGQSVKSSGDEA